MSKLSNFNRFIILVLQGIFIGIGNLIPGLNLGTLAVAVNGYETLIRQIRGACFMPNHFQWSKLIPLGIGIGVGLLASVVTQGLMLYPAIVFLFLSGIIIGSFPKLIKEISISNHNRVVAFLFGFSLFALLVIQIIARESVPPIAMIATYSIWNFFGTGILGGISVLVPGAGGNAFMFLLSVYQQIINNFSAAALPALFWISAGSILGTGCVAVLIHLLITKLRPYVYAVFFGATTACLIGLCPNSTFSILNQPFFILVGVTVSYLVLAWFSLKWLVRISIIGIELLAFIQWFHQLSLPLFGAALVACFAGLTISFFLCEQPV